MANVLSRQLGFTIMETMIVIAIITFFAGLGLFLSTDVYRSSIFRADTDIIAVALQRARSKAISNINESAHGVKIESSGYTIFQGDSFLTRDTLQDEFIKSNSALSFIGPTEVVFSQLSGESTAEGSLVVTNGFKTSTINLNYDGRIDW